MTKDGRPSLIRDIRYFGEDGSYLGNHEITAFGRQLALYLRSLDFSLGSWTHLYVHILPGTDASKIAIEPSTFPQLDWWFRYVRVPAPPRSALRGDYDLEALIEATAIALEAVRPDAKDVIQDACEVVRQHGDCLRFPVKTKRDVHDTIDICLGVSTHPVPSVLQAFVTAEGDKRQNALIDLSIYLDAWTLTNRVQLTKDAIIVLPRTSFTATMTAARHGGLVVFDRSAFQPCDPRLHFTSLISAPF